MTSPKKQGGLTQNDVVMISRGVNELLTVEIHKYFTRMMESLGNQLTNPTSYLVQSLSQTIKIQTAGAIQEFE